MHPASSFGKVTRAFALVAFFCLIAIVGVEAQISITNEKFKNYGKANESLKYYQIGDKLPKDFIVGYNPFDSTEVYTLKDFKGKAIILDCWATWCSSCISAFPKVDSLSKVYESKLTVLLINLQQRTPKHFGDSPQDVRDFIEKYSSLNSNFSPIFLIEKNRIQESFFFSGIPHYIWIDRNRRVRALTNARTVTGENIEKLFTGREIDVPVKKR